MIRSVSKAILTELEYAVLAATSSEHVVPKQKHVDTILKYVNNRSLSKDRVLVQSLHKRAKQRNWIVVLKTMLVVRKILTKQDKNLTQSILSNHMLVDLEETIDNSSLEAIRNSKIVIQYARYLQHIAREVVEQGIGPDHWNRVNADDRKTLTLTQIRERANLLLAALNSLVRCQFEDIPIQTPEEMRTEGTLMMTLFLTSIKDALEIYSLIEEYRILLLDRFFKLDKEDATTVFSFCTSFDDTSHSLSTMCNLLRKSSSQYNEIIPEISPLPSSLTSKLKDHIDSLEEKNSVPVVNLSSILNKMEVIHVEVAQKNDNMIDFNNNSYNNNSNNSYNNSNNNNNNNNNNSSKNHADDIFQLFNSGNENLHTQYPSHNQFQQQQLQNIQQQQQQQQQQYPFQQQFQQQQQQQFQQHQQHQYYQQQQQQYPFQQQQFQPQPQQFPQFQPQQQQQFQPQPQTQKSLQQQYQRDRQSSAGIDILDEFFSIKPQSSQKFEEFNPRKF